MCKPHTWRRFVLFYYYNLGSTPCKAEQPLRGMELQEKEEEKDEKDTGKLTRKLKDKRCRFTLYLKPYRS